MPSFGKKSMSELNSCERDIQTILIEVVKWRDCSITEGQRTAERQNFHWAKGRRLPSNLDPQVRSNWTVVDSQKVVTTKDGYAKLSIHQETPKSRAVDVCPYPEMWSSKKAFHELSGVIKATQLRLLAEGKITTLLDWGADLWNGFDKPHWQQKK